MALNLPGSVIAGDTLKFTASLPDYPASQGWTLTVILLALNARQTLTAVASDYNYSIELAESVTTTWKPITYRYVAKVEKSGEVYTVGMGSVLVTADFETTKETDTRRHVEIVLEALEAVIEKRATTDQQELSFNGRQMKHLQPGELLAWRDKYRAELSQIKAAERVSAGLGSGRLIKVRF